MSKKKSVIFTFIITLVAIYVSKILWPIINLPFDNKINIIGAYHLQKYNSINEILRYLIFIFFPLLVFFINIQFFFYNRLRTIKDIIYTDNSFKSFKIRSNYGLFFFLIFILIIVILGFTSVNFPTENIDSFHEGQTLTPAINYLLNKGLWSSSFMTAGLFREVLHSLIGFNIFDVQSIGSSRVIFFLLTLFIKFSIIFLIYQISKELNLEKNYKIIFFLLTSFLIFALTMKNIDSRDLPLFIFLNLLAHVLSVNKKALFINFFIGLLSIISFIWSIDKGAYLNFTLIILLTFFLVRKDHLQFFSVLIGIITGWVIFYLIVGSNEFTLFYYNTRDIFLHIEYVRGTIHPTPFSLDENSTRATKTLVAIIFSGILVIHLNFFENKIFNNKFKLLYIFLFILCVLSYRGALGLSDSQHIKQAEGFPEILIISLLSYNFLNFIIKSKFISNYINSKFIFYLMLIALINLIFYYEKIDFKKSLKFNQRMTTYVNHPNDFFLLNKQKESINELNNLLENEKCIAVFTEDAAIPFLVNRPSCSKFYMVYGGILTENHQKIFINELKNSKSKYIILDAPNRYKHFPNFFGHLNSFPLIKKYVLENYSLLKEINLWNIYKLKKNI